MLTNKNLFFLIIQAQIGIGILGLPYILYNDVHQDSWISFLIAGILAQGVIIVLVALSKVSPKNTLYELNLKLLGNFFGKTLNFMYILYFIAVSMLLILLVTDVINTWILHQTPRWAIILLLLLASSYIAKEHLLTISKTFLFFSILFIVLIFLLILVYSKADLTVGRLLPIGASGFLPILKASPDAFVSLIGFEFILFIMPFLKEPNKSLKVISLANIFTVSLYLFLIITCIIYFSSAQFSLVQQPLLYLFRGLSFEFVERIDIIFLSFWLVPISTTLVIQLFNASLGVQNLFSIQRKTSVYLIAFLLFGIGLFPVSPSLKESLSSLMTYLNIIFVFFIPILLLIISKIRVKKI
ncbi:GerAB/ArcD/ProY family transporter [Fictibacillus barbaricus]|uniref:Spore germination protein (Amino acid permease) n=1 Tax=Fictibacillus barbaricus TaxID=182136 RepID=A0ABU1U1F6_9BACL|nr:GerAB/ArcD/ProY family transporter [Fictibacillus barbaricus]MDR7073265.1 spore germination protein (amino acid permease) [Fictibacillus barbaricus]